MISNADYSEFFKFWLRYMEIPPFFDNSSSKNEAKEKSHFFFCVPGQAMDGLFWA